MKKKLLVAVFMMLLIGVTGFTQVKTFAEEEDAVTINDPVLKAAIYKNLGKEENDIVTVSELEKMGSAISASSEVVTDLTGIEHCIGCNNISLRINGETDLSALSYLREEGVLKYLTLYIEGMQEVPVVDGLKRLTIIAYCEEENSKVDLSGFSKYTKLDSLDIYGVHSDDWSKLEQFKPINSISIYDCDIEAVWDVTKNENLASISLNYNDLLKDLTGIKDSTTVEKLSIDTNKSLTDISGIEGNKSIKSLTLHKIDFLDSFNKNCKAIQSLEFLEFIMIYNDDFTDEHMALFENISNLKAVILFAGGNLTDVSILAKYKDTLECLSLVNEKKLNIGDLLEEFTSLQYSALNHTGSYDFSYVYNNKSLRSIGYYSYGGYFGGSGSKTETSRTVSYVTEEGKKELVISNDVRNHNGELVVPAESSSYTYNADTGEIVIDLASEEYLDNGYVKVSFKFNVEYQLEDVKASEVLHTLTVKSFIYGDANSDGTVNVLDAVLLKKSIAGFEGMVIDEAASDVNGDNNINVMDVVMILKKIAGFDVTLGKAL